METQNDLLNSALPPGALKPAGLWRAPSPLTAWNWTPIRQLHARHQPRMLAHLLTLSAADRWLRFGHVASDSQINHYVTQLDFARDELYGIFDSHLKLVAMAHLAFDEARRGAEFGVSVQTHLRGRGLGARLFERAVTQARNRGAQSLAIHIARENTAMLTIVRRAGAHLEYDGTEATAQLDLPGHTLATQVEALVESQAADIDYRIKMHVLRLDRLWPRLLQAAGSDAQAPEGPPREPMQG